MTTATSFVPADLELLLERYKPAEPADSEPRRPPWTWAALNHDERLTLMRMCHVFVGSYNVVHAVADTEVIPPCWVLHHELVAEVAVQVWLYYFAHLDPKASPAVAADYYGRHLPGFRTRVDRMLGRTPNECRKGAHDPNWRKPLDERIALLESVVIDEDDVRATVDLLGDLHFGFSHVSQ